MEIYWTSNKSINGLRHFVLVNKIIEQDQMNFLMVSVICLDDCFETTIFELSKDEVFSKIILSIFLSFFGNQSK